MESVSQMFQLCPAIFKHDVYNVKSHCRAGFVSAAQEMTRALKNLPALLPIDCGIRRSMVLASPRLDFDKNEVWPVLGNDVYLGSGRRRPVIARDHVTPLPLQQPVRQILAAFPERLRRVARSQAAPVPDVIAQPVNPTQQEDHNP